MSVILIIEDDEQVRVLAESVLRDAGYEVLAATAHEGAQALLNSDQSIDLLFVDVNLGGDPRDVPPQYFLPPIRARIVGIVLSQGEVSGSSDVFMTPAFDRAYANRAASLEAAIISLRHGLADFPAFSRGVEAISPQALVITTRDEAVYVHRSTHLQAVALWLFAGLAGFAGLVIFSQSLARQLFLDSTEYPTLRALGMTRGDLTGVAGAPGVPQPHARNDRPALSVPMLDQRLGSIGAHVADRPHVGTGDRLDAVEGGPAAIRR